MNTDVLIRLLFLAELVILFGCFTFALGVVKPILPRHLYLAGVAFMWTLKTIAIAIVINLAVNHEVSPGTYFSVVMLVPALAVACWSVRRSWVLGKPLPHSCLEACS